MTATFRVLRPDLSKLRQEPGTTVVHGTAAFALIQASEEVAQRLRQEKYLLQEVCSDASAERQASTKVGEMVVKGYYNLLNVLSEMEEVVLVQPVGHLEYLVEVKSSGAFDRLSWNAAVHSIKPHEISKSGLSLSGPPSSSNYVILRFTDEAACAKAAQELRTKGVNDVETVGVDVVAQWSETLQQAMRNLKRLLSIETQKGHLLF